MISVFLCVSRNTRQNELFSLAEGIRLAEIDDVAWVFHVDTDELMYPAGAGEFSLQVSDYAIKGLLINPYIMLQLQRFSQHIDKAHKEVPPRDQNFKLL